MFYGFYTAPLDEGSVPPAPPSRASLGWGGGDRGRHMPPARGCCLPPWLLSRGGGKGGRAIPWKMPYCCENLPFFTLISLPSNLSGAPVDTNHIEVSIECNQGFLGGNTLRFFQIPFEPLWPLRAKIVNTSTLGKYARGVRGHPLKMFGSEGGVISAHGVTSANWPLPSAIRS